MKRSSLGEEQIAYALRLTDSVTPVIDVCRQIGVSEATFYKSKKKFGDLGVTELKRLKMLEDVNVRQKANRGRSRAAPAGSAQFSRTGLGSVAGLDFSL
jgi:putative transposase